MTRLTEAYKKIESKYSKLADIYSKKSKLPIFKPTDQTVGLNR